MSCEYEGIIPALETSHAIWSTVELAKTLPKEANIVMVRLFPTFPQYHCATQLMYMVLDSVRKVKHFPLFR